MISAIDNDKDYLTALKKTDMLDVIRWVAEVWEEIPNISIASFWRKLLHPEPACETVVEDETNKLVSLLEKNSVL